MNDTATRSQYSTGLSRSNIEHALVAAGKNTDHLQPSDLALVEDFHTMGRIATSQLVDQIGITSGDSVLDAGSGIGGTARYLADRFGCKVTAVDLTEEYCQTAIWLNQLVGLHDQICVRQANVVDLPFPDAGFDVVFSQHVQMNVADKAGLYREARRVLATGGRLALWDITVGEHGEPDYPLPWADRPDVGHLVSPDQLHAVVESAGFAVEQWSDLSDEAASTMQMMLTLPANPLGLHAFVADFAEKARNLTSALVDGRLRAVRGVARATGPDHIAR
jgi:sarcosine/dimethylglycine N-methyltransferase